MAETEKKSNFIRERIIDDLNQGRNTKGVVTRFPPEPNGYLHIGHAKSIILNFGLAQEFNGRCHLRFDDTNPGKENPEYVDSIKEDVRWFGFDWGEHLYYASDYFERIYEYAEELIEKGLAYVCDLSQEEIREYRGTLKEPGKNSPYRGRSVEENLKLFRQMREGRFREGEKVLRAKIDMSSGNLNMRDPVIYRILKKEHHRTGDKWNIYPMYDLTHCISDAIEGITYSLCTLEFEDNRPLYHWVLDNISIDHHPPQIEFARLNITYTVLSKRKLQLLINRGVVSGWKDPRMPTIAGMRRRGYTPESIKNFCERIGVAKRDSTVDLALLDYCLREDLNKRAQRRMAVLDPLKVVIENYPEGETEKRQAVNNPEDDSAGIREITFGRELYIERGDFMEDPPKKFYRLAPGREVRLRYGYFLKCREAVKDSAGNVVELRCTYDPETSGGKALDGRKVKSTIHWVSAHDCVEAEVRLYNNLFKVERPEFLSDEELLNEVSSDSLTKCSNAKLEWSLGEALPGDIYQFERKGYFCADPDSDEERVVFNRSVTLRDEWAKILKKKNKG